MPHCYKCKEQMFDWEAVRSEYLPFTQHPVFYHTGCFATVTKAREESAQAAMDRFKNINPVGKGVI